MVQQEQRVHLHEVVSCLRKRQSATGRLAGWRPFLNENGHSMHHGKNQWGTEATQYWGTPVSIDQEDAIGN